MIKKGQVPLACNMFISLIAHCTPASSLFVFQLLDIMRGLGVILNSFVVQVLRLETHMPLDVCLCLLELELRLTGRYNTDTNLELLLLLVL